MRELLKRSGALVLGLALVFPASASKPPIEKRMAMDQLSEMDNGLIHQSSRPRNCSCCSDGSGSMALRRLLRNCSPEVLISFSPFAT